MNKEIIVYSTPFCAPCEQLKHFLKDEGIAFTVKDLMTDEAAAELMDQRGVHSAPALSIDGKILWGADLSRDNLRHALDL